jgi:hypothetical protein
MIASKAYRHYWKKPMDTHKTCIKAVFAGIGVHFFCCILPAGLAVVNLILGTDYALSLDLMGHRTEDIILIISGAALIAAGIVHFRRRIKDDMLWIAAGLWIFSVIAHYITH